MQLTLERDPAGQDLVAHLGAHVFAERLPEKLSFPEPVEHAIEALGHRTDLVVAHDGAARLEVSPLDVAHGGLELPQRSGHAVGHEQREPDGHGDADGGDEDAGDEQGADHGRRAGRIEPGERRRSPVGHHAED